MTKKKKTQAKSKTVKKKPQASKLAVQSASAALAPPMQSKPYRSVVVTPPPAKINPADVLIDGQPLPRTHQKMSTGALPPPPPKSWNKPVR
jgi:hypothetical protein